MKKSNFDGEVVELPDYRIQRLINYSNTYYKKYSARLVRFKDADAYMVQYLVTFYDSSRPKTKNNLEWENAFCVNKKQLDKIFEGDTVLRKESVA